MNSTARLRQILMQLDEGAPICPSKAYVEALELVREIERASYGEGLTITDDDGDKVEFHPSVLRDSAIILAVGRDGRDEVHVRLTPEDLVAIVDYINYVQEEK